MKNLVLGMSLFVSQFAYGHIDLDEAGTHLSRYGRRYIKQGPCGKKDGERSSNVYTYKAGETISVKLREFIPHPGYFRIAFDSDGDDDFVNPQSINPINRKCLEDEKHCGEDDFFNNETVLLDNLNPHKRGLPKTYEWKIKLPDVECDNCTLQFIQVMTDGYPIHAPYDPAMDSDDLYYQCIDLKLVK